MIRENIFQFFLNLAQCKTWQDVFPIKARTKFRPFPHFFKANNASFQNKIIFSEIIEIIILLCILIKIFGFAPGQNVSLTLLVMSLFCFGPLKFLLLGKSSLASRLVKYLYFFTKMLSKNFFFLWVDF